MFCAIPLLMLISDALALLMAEKPYYDLTEAESHFADFIQKYGVQYKTKDEHDARVEIFKEHLVNIHHLKQYTQIYNRAYSKSGTKSLPRVFTLKLYLEGIKV